MTRKLKALGLALLALGAMSAIAAQAASATTVVNHEFETTSAPVVLTGTSTTNHVYSLGGVPAVCEVLTFVGTQSEATVDHITVTPSLHTNCKLGSTTIHVTNNGCSYTFDSDTVDGSARVSIVCNHTGSITFTDSGGACVIHFSDTHTNGVTVNQNLPGVTYANAGTPPNHDVSVAMNVAGIAYEATGFGCTLIGIPSTGVNGTTTVSMTVRAYEDVGSSGENKHNNVQVGWQLEEDTES